MDIISDDLSALGVSILPSGRIRYPAGYDAYAVIYDAEARTVRSWVADGKKVGELPPLPDPARMVGWWQRRRRQRVPPGILAAAGTSAVQGSPLTDDAPDDDEKKARNAHGGDDEKNDDDGALGGAEIALRQAREMAAMAYQRLMEARQMNDPGGVEQWRKDWTESVETQRKWEKDFDRIQEMRGLLVRKSAVQVELATVANVLQRAFLAEMEGLLKEHCPALSPEARRAAAVSRRDRCFEVLRRGSFGSDLFMDKQ